MARGHVIAALLVAITLIAGCGSPGPSGPAPSPRVTCVDVPPEKCDLAVASVGRSLPNDTPAAIDVTCVAASCTSSSGAMDTVVTLPDGRQLHASPLSWGGDVAPAGPPGRPALPVPPICLGVPAESCEQNATADFPDAAAHGGVVKIVVRCTKDPCTSTSGEGDTMITFADGETRTVGWSYMTAS